MRKVNNNNRFSKFIYKEIRMNLFRPNVSIYVEFAEGY